MAEQPLRAVFLDRDGTLNVDRPDYVKDWKEFVWLPGVAESLLLLSGAGYQLVVVTNQGSISKGLTTIQAVEDLHTRMEADLAERGVRLAGVYYCPHHDVDRCDCRKPAPGLLLRASRELNLDLGNSWMVGDAERDVQAGAAAGCRTIRLRHGFGIADATRQILEDTGVSHARNSGVLPRARI